MLFSLDYYFIICHSDCITALKIGVCIALVVCEMLIIVVDHFFFKWQLFRMMKYIRVCQTYDYTKSIYN